MTASLRLVRLYDEGWRLAFDTGRRRKSGTQAHVILLTTRRRWLPARHVDAQPDLAGGDPRRLRRAISVARRHWQRCAAGGLIRSWPKQLGRRPPIPRRPR